MTNKGNGADTTAVEIFEAQASDPVDQADEPPFPIRVAVIDDGVAIPTFDLFDDPDHARSVLEGADDLHEDLATIGTERDDDPAVNLASLLDSGQRLASLGELAETSEAFRARWDDYLFHRSLRESLESLVDEVIAVDPSQGLPDLSSCEIIFLDYYLEDPAKGGALAEEIARQLIAQPGRSVRQQIILMSNQENVSKERRVFRKKADIPGASFAFVPKSELASRWQVFTHLAVLDRARPMAPKIDAYHDALTKAVREGAETFLELINELDIDDYANLQSVALMKDGDPLGEYVASLFATELTSRTIEAGTARTAERELDAAEFPGQPHAASEPSTIVKSLFHSALISSNVGALGDHPRADPDGPYAGIPLVRMGDLFFSDDKKRAICVVSADCHLAFAPNEERAPDPETSVLLVSGPTQQVTETGDPGDHATEGLVEGDEVYRINWEFAAFQSVPLAKLQDHLTANGFDVTHRDRLRAPFSFDLQQSFGANLFRVGTPAMPPITREVTARALLVHKDEIVEERVFDDPSMRLTWYKRKTHARFTLTHVEELRQLCRERHDRIREEHDTLVDKLEESDEKSRGHLKKRIEKLDDRCASILNMLDDATVWDKVHGDHSIGSDIEGVCKLVRGQTWPKNANYMVVVQVDD